MEEPESRVREESEGAEGRDVEVWANAAETPTMYDDIDDVDFDPAELQIEEGMVAEVMKRLEEEINRPCGGGGDFAPQGHFQQCQVVPSLPSPFVTINGNEESCGPSFSDSASTVMASIDTRGVVRLPQFVPVCEAKAEEIWPWSPEPGAEASAFALPPAGAGDAAADFGVEDIGVAGDDGWLARVLAGAGLEGDGEERLGG